MCWITDSRLPSVLTTPAHERRSGWVTVNIIAKDGTPPPVDPVDPVDPVNPGNDGNDGNDGNNGENETMARTTARMARTVNNGETTMATTARTVNNGGERPRRWRNGGNDLVDGNTGNDGNGGTPGGPGIEPPRQRSSDATLRDLVLSHGTTVEPLTPGFMPETEMYAATVGVTVTQVTVTPTPNHPRAQVAYLDENDRVLTDASDRNNEFQVETVAGDTVIKVKVTAEDGSTMKTYTVTVTRPPSSDATLRDLDLSHRTKVVPLTPAFMSDNDKNTRQTVESARDPSHGHTDAEPCRRANHVPGW